MITDEQLKQLREDIMSNTYQPSIVMNSTSQDDELAALKAENTRQANANIELHLKIVNLTKEKCAFEAENERLKEELDETIEAIKEGDKENERLNGQVLHSCIYFIALEQSKKIKEYAIKIVEQHDEIKLLKVENERLAEAYRDMGETMFKVNEENERLKEDYEGMRKWCKELTDINVENEHQYKADKAEHRQIILRMITYLDMDAIPKMLSDDINLLLSKHEAK